LTAELLQQYESNIESITLLPSDGGRFEVTVDGKLIFSKISTGRHANPGEVEQLIGKLISGR